MKTILFVCCILGISLTVIFTNIESHVYELVETTNQLIDHNKQPHIDPIIDHSIHNDVVEMNGKI